MRVGPTGTITSEAREPTTTRLVRGGGGDSNAISHTKKIKNRRKAARVRGARTHTRGGALGALVAVGRFWRVGGTSKRFGAFSVKTRAVGRSVVKGIKKTRYIVRVFLFGKTHSAQSFSKLVFLVGVSFCHSLPQFFYCPQAQSKRQKYKAQNKLILAVVIIKTIFHFLPLLFLLVQSRRQFSSTCCRIASSSRGKTRLS